MINQVMFGDCRETMKTLEPKSVQMCVTSPPYYGLRDYGHDGQLGPEDTPEQYIANMVEVFREVKRVLKDDGTLWVNIGDSYAGSGKGSNPDGTPHPSTLLGKQGTNTGTVTGRHMPQKAHTIGLKPKDLIGIPWMLAFALRADGWYLRQDIIWHKPNPMPESVTDRCTKSHEYIFLLSKSQKYYFDHEAIKEPSVTNEGRPSGIVRDREYEYDSKQSMLRKSRDNFKRDGSKRGVDGICPASPTPTHRADRQQSEYDLDSRNKRSVWTVNTKPYSGAHFAVFPEALIEPCILAGSKVGATVLDPFFGSGTTGQVCENLGREWIGCELNPAYGELQKQRTAQQGMVFE